MDKNTILHVLTSMGVSEPFAGWKSLNGCVSRINLLPNVILSIDPRYRLYMFDEADQILYVKYLDGFNATDINNTGIYVTQNINGVEYKAPISRNYVIGKHGEYHQAISFSQIVSFTYIDRMEEKQMWLQD